MLIILFHVQSSKNTNTQPLLKKLYSSSDGLLRNDGHAIVWRKILEWSNNLESLFICLIDGFQIKKITTTQKLTGVNVVDPLNTKLRTVGSVEIFFSSMVIIYATVLLLTLTLAAFYYFSSSEQTHDELWNAPDSLASPSFQPPSRS